ncbi:MAG: PPC domain-containing protein, partial [Planctomycetaceae bacterium]|nr:PPC domain-containing protein [Planctomycetaceae bacterium]
MRHLNVFTLLFFWLFITPVQAEIDHLHSVLQSVYPAGGCRGTKVEVTFTGYKDGLDGANGLLIDGDPGITVEKFETLNSTSVKATLVIAEDAIPGRRLIRVKGGPTGLTNFRWFFVGTLPEFQESQKNNELTQVETVQTPVVVNGRIEKTLDQDCFRFEARAGEKLVVAVQSHGLDAMGFDRNTAGFADASLELLDASGRIVAEDGDSLGYDPIIHYEVPHTGKYIVRVSGMGYKGFPQFIYRLTIGEVPYPTAIFPPGGKRGEEVEVTFSGPNVPPGTKRTLRVGEGLSPVEYISLDGAAPDLPFVRSNQPELWPKEPGNQPAEAFPITQLPVVINGVFDQPDDVDWFRLDLNKGETIFLDVLAQRHLRSPVDTLLEVYDTAAKLLAANDDSELLLSEVNHEFVPFDSQLRFQAKDKGTYFVKLSEQSGAGGPRAVYRLSITPDAPDFALYQWPDAVPVWGSGTTAAFVVEIHRFGGLKNDVEISIEG